MRKDCFLLGVAVLAAWGVAGVAPVEAAEDEAAWLTYRYEGGFSPYRQAFVRIGTSGKSHVAIDMRSDEKKDVDYETMLSTKEREELQKLIADTGFFTIPEEEQGDEITDAGLTQITVTQPERTRTLKFRHRKELEPLTRHLWRLILQAEAIQKIETDDDVYTASGVVNELSAGAKALQPDRLRAPLMKYIRNGKDRQKIQWAFSGLVWVVTPGEYREFVKELLEKPERVDLIFSALPLVNGPDLHSAALCPLFLEYANELDARREKLTDAERRRLEVCVETIGYWRYEPGIPLFVSLVERNRNPADNPVLPRLDRMGPAGLTAMLPLLDSSLSLTRRHTVELMIRASRGNPKSGFADPYPAKVYERMVPVFEKAIFPRLTKMKLEDADKEVRRKAAEGLEEIPKRILE
jgi:hypothetical protein